MITRTDFFRQPQPQSLATALGYLIQLRELGLVFHLDDDPETIIVSATNERMFRDREVYWLRKFVKYLRQEFWRCCPKDEQNRINAGAWYAAEVSGYFRSDPRIVVEVAGGVCQAVYCSQSASVDVLDRDNKEACDPSNPEHANEYNGYVGLESELTKLIPVY